MSVVIKVENVSKLYRLGEVGTGSLAHDVNRWWHRMRGNEDPYLKIGQVNDRTKAGKKETGDGRRETVPADCSASQETGDGYQETGPAGTSSSSLSPDSCPLSPSSSSLSPVSCPPSPDLPSSDYVYALKDINFEVKQGEVLGIIGRNGAGKSTLLKILSRVTTPTTGQIKVKGRIASLLEVGTGFHPELTGRENIFLNGAILGMRKAEIKAKFDEIVDFSGCERYIDTPVKRYSSGMYVRLAFAVAAHLEPEILIVDEVLAVGDAEFQKKCLGKMKDVAGQGRTVLFVSHNMAAVRSLCSSCLWIDCGLIREAGLTSEILDHYLRSSTKDVNASEVVLPEDLTKEFQVREARVTKPDGEVCTDFLCDEEISLELLCEVRNPVPGLYGYLQISRRDGTEVLVSDSFDSGENPVDNLSHGRHTLRITVPERSLAPGEYVTYFSFTSPMSAAGFSVDCPGDLLSFQITDPNTKRGNNRGGFFGTLLPWQITPCSPRPEIASRTRN
jgi:lipopolysaccharide transport system ATP-binding protein